MGPSRPWSIPSPSSRDGFLPIAGNLSRKLAKLTFPQFNGDINDNLKPWLSRCDSYFEIWNYDK